jgi:predicted CxxxxCH...CXXCH cytochrome family protein
VNGRADVVFDARTALPALPWLPAAPNTPTRPYWLTDASAGFVPADAVREGTTLSFHLANARYDAATKTCSNVGCHLEATAVVWGGANAFDRCTTCHVF